MKESNPFRLLLVEEGARDSEAALKRIVNVFDTSFTYTQVSTLQQAIEELSRVPYHGVILDLHLPDSVGLETLRAVRAVYPKDVIIVLSLDISETRRNEVALEGCIDIFDKTQPFTDQLTRSVLFWFERHWVREEHALLERLISATPDAVIVIDADCTVLFVNEAALELFGKRREDLLGDFMGFSISEGTVSEITILRGRETRTAEMRIVDFTWESKPAYLASIRDITERKRAEEEIRRQAEELARSNEDLQQFAYVASHDLQEPLRTVSSFAQLLEKRYKGQLDEQADRWIGFIVEGSTRMQSLIRDLLSYSRVGTHGSKFSVCDMNDALIRALKNLEASIIECGAQFDYQALPIVRGDCTQLISLLQNLIGNAIKYKGEEPPLIYIGVKESGEEYVFSIRDNGIGIEPQFFERIFVIFQRLHTRKHYSGTGIGLAICRRIVDRHGGRIWVESAPGAGATFYFTLPMMSYSA